MYLRIAWLLVLVILASSLVTDAQVVSGAVAQPVTIPFEPYDNLIFVDVRVNGSAPQIFLLDSGASTSFLNQTLADSLGVGPKHKHQMNVGAGESSASLGFAHDVTLSLPGGRPSRADCGGGIARKHRGQNRTQDRRHRGRRPL
jgi:hypothetical protein